MLNLQDNEKGWLFDTNFPKDHVETAGCDLACITRYIPSLHPSVSWTETKGQLLFVCIYYERAPRLRLEKLHRRYEKGEVGDARAYRILHSIAYKVRAVGGTRRYQPGNWMSLGKETSQYSACRLGAVL